MAPCARVCIVLVHSGLPRVELVTDRPDHGDGKAVISEDEFPAVVALLRLDSDEHGTALHGGTHNCVVELASTTGIDKYTITAAQGRAGGDERLDVRVYHEAGMELAEIDDVSEGQSLLRIAIAGIAGPQRRIHVKKNARRKRCPRHFC